MKKEPVDILETARTEITELNDYLDFCESAIINMESAERLANLTREVLEKFSSGRIKTDSQEFVERLKNAKRTTQRAKREKEEGNPYLYRLGVIWLWAIFEATFDDFSISFLRAENRWLKIDGLRKIKGSFIEFAAASEEQQDQILLDAIKQHIAAPLKIGAGRFEEVFNLIGLGGPVDPQVAKVFVEFSATRNLFVHRRGVVDHNFIRLCPWVKSEIGSVLKVDRPIYRRFYTAVSWYSLEVIARFAQVMIKDPTAVPACREGQRQFIEYLGQCEKEERLVHLPSVETAETAPQLVEPSNE